jgi:hypothetical protein
MEPLGVEVGEAAARGQAELGDEEGHLPVVGLEALQVLAVAPPLQARLVDQEVGVVGVHVVGGEEARGAIGGGAQVGGVQGHGVLFMEGACPRGLHPFPAGLPQAVLLLEAGLAFPGEGVQGGPVDEAQRSCGAVGLPLVLGQAVQDLGEIGLKGARPGEGLYEAAPVGPPRVALVVGGHGVGLKLPPHQKAQGPRGDVGGVVPVGVAGLGRAAEVAVEGVQDLPPFQEELFQEGALPVPVALLLGEFRPDALEEVEGALGVGQVVAQEGPVEGGRQEGVDPDGVGPHGGEELQPGPVEPDLLRELGREAAW